MTDPARDRTRVRLLSALLLLTVFVAGSLTGAATLDGSPDTRTPTTSTSVRATHDLTALDLSDGQRERVDEILERHQPAADAIIQDAMNDLRALMADVNDEVRGVLSPDQIEALDSLMSEGPRIQAVRRTMTLDGTVLDADTIR